MPQTLRPTTEIQSSMPMVGYITLMPLTDQKLTQTEATYEVIYTTVSRNSFFLRNSIKETRASKGTYIMMP